MISDGSPAVEASAENNRYIKNPQIKAGEIQRMFLYPLFCYISKEMGARLIESVTTRLN